MKEIPTGWNEDDIVITCYRIERGIVYDPPVIALCCELCNTFVAAAPVTAREQSESGAHVVCRECFATLPTPMLFKGRIKRGATELPK